MYKIFILAATIAVFPLAENLSPRIDNKPDNAEQLSCFKFKNVFSDCFADNAKTITTESWSQNWMATAQENIRKSEYNFKWEEKLKAYCTPNRKQNLRFFYNDKGFTVEPRTTQIPIGDFDPAAMPDEIKYKTIPNWKVQFNLDKKQVGKGLWKVTENKAEYITDKITVQYINNDEGMRQNFIVHAPLLKNNSLKIKFSILTKLKHQVQNNCIQFFHKKVGVVLKYDQLKVWDANGKPLEAVIKKKKRNIYSININTDGAVYPVIIDPISTTPAAFIENNQDGAQSGYSIASAGDVNGDGYSDLIVGAPFYDNGQVDEGVAFIYYGSISGINITAAATVESNQVNARLGYSIASAGDVNGDGFSDVIAGVYLYTNGELNEGAAFIYYGSVTGISITPNAVLESNISGTFLGWSVACAGDVNGDGYSDVIAGAINYSNGEANEGACYVYHGSATGIVTPPAIILESNLAVVFMGVSVASAGDVNGDGYSDIITGGWQYENGESQEGAAFIYHGSAAGINVTPAITIESNQANAWMGWSVSSAGDVNGDGYSDVAIGAYGYTNGQSQEGVVFVYHGSAAGISSSPSALLETNQQFASMGWSVASVGDINGDGYSDIITGAPFYNNGIYTDNGTAFLFMGSATGLSTTPQSIITDANQSDARFGWSVASAGDVNGDGYSDVVIGAPFFDNGQTDEGAAFVYHGSAAGVNITETVMVEGNQVNATMGVSVAFAGDVNGDGYGDIIVGAHQYNNGQTQEGVAFVYHGSPTGINTTAAAIVESNQSSSFFGISVAGAGDVNGDGFSDVVVGASNFVNGQSGEGAIFIYHGSPTGISTTAAVIIESNIVNTRLGQSVACAGDVNGNGYSDVIAGASFFSNGEMSEGAFFIYHGSSTGISATAAAMVESNQANAGLGGSVSNAGDVNGDGYSDVIVGAQSFTNGQSNEGAAFVYHGSPTGISTTAAAMVESNQSFSNFGRSVSSAGDVNGDGYSDIIVGANFYDNGENNEGRAYVYHGSATGVSTSATVIIEPNQANAEMGISVACAGDVNGDGYSDVIVGAQSFTNGQPFEGAAFIYNGSPTGISAVASAMLEANPANVTLGWSVASAGDVNGDGYSDVIASAWNYANGEFGEGAFFVYHSNGMGTNKRNNLRLYNTDLTTPINSSNYIFSNFGAGLYAKSFLGRAKGKLVWETRLNYNAYSGTPITNSTFFTAQQAAYTDMGLTGVELKNVIDKIAGANRYTKLRARIKYDPVTSITGQVYSPWRNVSSIIDANNLGALPIELISFNAAWLQKGKTARLDFTTDKESGICCFDIEKSADGFHFYSIGTLPAKNVSGIQTYSFIDNNATNKKQFYRLKIKGIAGQVEYSNIQQLQNNGSTEILVFPNPTTDILQLQLNNAFDKMNVRIINSAGQLVKQMQFAAINQTIAIPVQNLATGKYWLRLQSGEEKQVLQFVKQ